MYLHLLSNNTFALSQCVRDDRHHIWLTYIIESESSGDLWQCHFNSDTELFALKVVEMLSHDSDIDCQQLLHNEFDIYQTLEDAYTSGQLCSCITPHCYGAFKSDHIHVLLLEHFNCVLNTWDELNTSEQWALLTWTFSEVLIIPFPIGLKYIGWFRIFIMLE